MIRIATSFALASIIALGAGSAFAAGSAPSAVSASDDGSQEVLRMTGVNFDDAAQAKAFYNRLQYAAARVCADARSSGACQREALNDAIDQIGSAQLDRLAGRASRADQYAAKSDDSAFDAAATASRGTR